MSGHGTAWHGITWHKVVSTVQPGTRGSSWHTSPLTASLLRASQHNMVEAVGKPRGCAVHFNLNFASYLPTLKEQRHPHTQIRYLVLSGTVRTSTPNDRPLLVTLRTSLQNAGYIQCTIR
jgi:hypothetical protein